MQIEISRLPKQTRSCDRSVVLAVELLLGEKRDEEELRDGRTLATEIARVFRYRATVKWFDD